MLSARAIILLALSFTTQATRSTRSTYGIVQWGPCTEPAFANTTLPIQCGILRVPLDYTDLNSTALHDISLLKIPAPLQPKKGSIQFNFGGPGLPVRAGLLPFAPIFQTATGGVYDLIAFDPRGVSKELPFICTNDSLTLGSLATEMRSGEEPGALKRLWARGEIDANICKQDGNGEAVAGLVGTTFMARDTLKVAEALDEDGLIRYWGFSYGTTLGATIAAMFPDKIGGMIIDGVSNTKEYYNANADFEQWSDTDKAFSAFFSTCIEAGPDLCPLAALNKTASELEQDHWDFVDKLIEAPIPSGKYLLDILTMKGLMLEFLKVTQSWPRITNILIDLIYGTEAQQKWAIKTYYSSVETSGTDNYGFIASFWAIHLGDTNVRKITFEDAVPTFDKLRNTSRLWGGPAAGTSVHSAQWPWHTKERYTGNFEAKTKNPILVMSNTIDSHTPLRSAKNVSASLEGSVVLEVNGIGHCTMNVPSLCALQHEIAYWTNGTLPEPGTICQPAVKPWGNGTWADVLKNFTGKETKLAAREQLVVGRSIPLFA